MFKMRMEGSDQLQRKLKRIEENIDPISGSRTIPIQELLNDEFMKGNTNYQTCQEMFDESPFKIESHTDFDVIPDDQRNAYISLNTKFSDWNGMLEEAAKEMIQRELSQGLRL